MEKKSQGQVDLCAVSKEIVTKRLDALVSNPSSKAVLDEYFMWVAILNSPIDLVDNSKKKEVPDAE